jgi:VIT1/CCC1 family predicted Fe2+/Mn2+ transporter
MDRNARLAIHPEWISFGGTSAIVTSMGLILGLDAAGATQKAIVGALLIVAVADNLSDSLSVHIYQEAERLEKREAFISTVANFTARLLAALTFVVLVLALPAELTPAATIAWGLVLLALLTERIARARGAPIAKEVGKHLAVAGAVLVVSRVLGTWISGSFG